MSSVHSSAVGANTQPRRSTVSSNEAPSQAAEPSTDEGMPPQRHAGAVGLGPAYHQGPGFGEKIIGLEEEIKGKIMRKPDLVEHGRERRTGELKKKEEREQDEKEDPFAKPGDQAAPSPQKKGPGEAGTL